MKFVKYRIVTDNYLGYEVQVWRLWFPFWIQCHGSIGFSNTWSSIDDAKQFIETKRKKTGEEVWRS